MMNLSEVGKNLIKSFEGCKLQVYRDVVGILTVGYGHVDSSLKMGDIITQDQANSYFDQDIAKFENGVSHLAPDATQCQFDALCSFAYNLGLRSLQTSTLLKKFLEGDIQGAADEFPKWSLAGGHVVDGLVRRRQAERLMFLGE